MEIKRKKQLAAKIVETANIYCNLLGRKSKIYRNKIMERAK